MNLIHQYRLPINFKGFSTTVLVQESVQGQEIIYELSLDIKTGDELWFSIKADADDNAQVIWKLHEAGTKEPSLELIDYVGELIERRDA